jgi:hypothetical protein
MAAGAARPASSRRHTLGVRADKAGPTTREERGPKDKTKSNGKALRAAATPATYLTVTTRRKTTSSPTGSATGALHRQTGVRDLVHQGDVKND